MRSQERGKRERKEIVDGKRSRQRSEEQKNKCSIREKLREEESVEMRDGDFAAVLIIIKLITFIVSFFASFLNTFISGFCLQEAKILNLPTVKMTLSVLLLLSSCKIVFPRCLNIRTFLVCTFTTSYKGKKFSL